MANTAVVLAGGEGRRLRPYTTVLPKPLLPVGDQSILEIILRQLASSGFTEVVLAVGYLAELIEAFAGDGSRFGIKVRYVRESGKLGTAAPIARIGDLPDPVLVMNGDVLTDLDYSAILRHHESSGAMATVAVIRRALSIEFGVVETDEAGMLAELVEKPSLSHLISTGINVLSAEAISMIPQEGQFDLPDLIHALKRADKPVAVFEMDGTWLDIGRPSDYEAALAELEANPGRYLQPGKA
ncbi:MAG: nucleoside-diphosphate-sugar pyrophosphorylase [Acidobacteria bacterium]|nr:MAG: nucleoside-diphosphate-sugar pyrophosphorylase [Acidobacteriota bacterium]